MARTTTLLVAGVVAIGAMACSDLTTSDENSLVLGEAFQSVPMGFSQNSTTYDASGDRDLPFFPSTLERGTQNHDGGPGHGDSDDDGDSDGDSDRHNGFGLGGIRGLLMGGGLHPEFLGVYPFNKGRHHGPFSFLNLPDDCAFDQASGRVTCPDRTKRGLTISSSYAFKDLANVAQPRFVRGVTNSVNVRIAVEGTRARDDRDATATVEHESDRTVTGLAEGATERTVNGISGARETVTGVREGVAFTAVRLATDTTTGIVIPLRDGRPTIPSAGTIVRRMEVTITPDGGEPVMKKRREAVTFNGTNVVAVEITQNGVTKNCTITLPKRKLVCE